MNSVSSGTGANRPDFHSSFTSSILSRRDETKFHQTYRGPSKAKLFLVVADSTNLVTDLRVEDLLLEGLV
jgi:hypothetical protein